MTDTSPEIAALVRARLMSLSGPERFLMGVRMCEAARRMVVASLPSDLPASDRKQRLFQRFQGQSLPDGMMENAEELVDKRTEPRAKA